MIRHTVVFKLKYPKGSPEEMSFLLAAADLARIPGIQNFEILLQTSPKTDFDYGISMEFATKELYQAYNIHPDHKYFVGTYWTAYVANFLEIDYEPLL